MNSVCGKDYDFIFLDAQIILTRNHSMVSSKIDSLLLDDEGNVNHQFWVFNEIVRQSVASFWFSVRKLLKAYSTNRLVFLWDKSPYYKSQIIEDIYNQDTYKVDRVYENTERSWTLFLARQAARKHIMNFGPKFGMNSVLRRGYEADDLAFLAARMFPKYKVGLASHDSDWPFYLTPNAEIINTMSFKLTYYDEFRERLMGMDPYQYVIHSHSFYGSHNNLLQTVSDQYYKQSFEETYRMFVEGKDYEHLFSDWKLFVAQMQSWNIFGFPEIDEVWKQLWEASTSPIQMGTAVEWIDDLYNGGSYSYVYEDIKSKLT